jgi:hypothetical protein
MDMNKINQLDLRSRVISTQPPRSAKKKSQVYGVTAPRLEFVKSNISSQQLLEDIDTDYDEYSVMERPKSPIRTNITNDQPNYSGQNSPSATQFITSSPQNSASAQRASINNQNHQEPKEQENMVDMIKLMMLQLNQISSRMDRFEQIQAVQEIKLRDPVVEQVQPIDKHASPIRSNLIEVLTGKDSKDKKTHAGKNTFNYSNDIFNDDEDDNGEGVDSDDDSDLSNSSYGSRSQRVKVTKAIVLDKHQTAWNWWITSGFKLWTDYMNLSENIDDANFIFKYARISNIELGGVPFMLPNGTVMMLRTKGKSSLKLSMVLEAICSFMGADPFLQKSGAMLTNDFFPSKIADFLGFLDELRTIGMYMGKHGLKLFGTRSMQVSDISLINEFLLKIQAKATSVVSPNGKNRVTNYAAFFMIFLKIWNNAFMNEDLRLLVCQDALSYMNNQCNMFIGNNSVHPALSISQIMRFFGWVCPTCGLLGVCNLYCSNCRSKGDKNKDDKMTLEKAYVSQEIMTGTNTRDFNAFYSRSGLSV